MSEVPDLKSWIGRSESERDVATMAPLKGLEALLDRDLGLPESAVVPPLGHWLYFLPKAAQSLLDEDGHPVRGGFLPPVDLPRRMWAGGKVVFHAPIPIGAEIERTSVIANVEEKAGETGRLVFVTVKHEIRGAGQLLIEERQDLVYRGAAAEAKPASKAAPPREARAADVVRRIAPTPMLLFRYSALTFNAHRIHYDRDYAREVEGYPGLVVHGPLSATLLMDLFARQPEHAAPKSFEFRARKPLFDTAPLDACLAWASEGADLWTAGPDGQPAMTARVEVACRFIS